MEILSETPVSAYQLKEELEKIKKRDKELNFRAAKTEEHLNILGIPKNLDELHEKISKNMVNANACPFDQTSNFLPPRIGQ